MANHPTLELVASYNSLNTQHLSERGERETLCGRNRSDWMVCRAADLTLDLDNAYTCKRCVRAATS